MDGERDVLAYISSNSTALSVSVMSHQRNIPNKTVLYKKSLNEKIGHKYIGEIKCRRALYLSYMTRRNFYNPCALKYFPKYIGEL